MTDYQMFRHDVSPLLFLIYINGITDLRLTSESLYAEDILVFESINKMKDYVELQNNMSSLYKWSQESSLTFNLELITRKC